MDKAIGKVLEVFIPEEYVNNQKIDVMDSSKIGFRILLHDREIRVVCDMDEDTGSILKNDQVMVTYQVVDNLEFVSVERCDIYGTE